VKGSVLDAVRRGLAPGEIALFDALLAEAEKRQVAMYLVGGPVRDLLLGRELRDVDLIVEPRAEVPIGAEDLARAAAPAGAPVLAHDRFGTVRIETADGALDVATVRRESYARPGALPSVEPGTLDDDLRRRDFTVNALAAPITTAARRGRPALIDPESGRDDLSRGVLRVFHAASFHDDPTRALRAARLAERLGFQLSRGSRTALRDAIGAGAFSAVSGDRWRREFEKLFDDARRGLDPAAALRMLAEWHVLGALEPGLNVPKLAIPALRRLGRSLAAPPLPAARLRPWAVGLAVWLADLDATSRRRTLRRLAVRGELAQRITEFPRLRNRCLRTLATARGRGAVDALLGDIDDERLLALFAYAPPASRRRLLRWALEDRTRRPPVTGADLVAAGLAGPVVGAALARIRLAWLDGAVHTREEAIALARELGARLGRRSAARPRKVAKRGTTRSTTAKSTKASLPATEASSILPPASPPTRALHPERQ
jgi:tRNA nucleotidyltransferase (CCA-adding enzyme)